MSLFVAFSVHPSDTADRKISSQQASFTVKYEVFDDFVAFATSDSVSALYRVCLHETTANASSVYFEGFDEAAAGLLHAGAEPLLCLERTMSLQGMIPPDYRSRLRCDFVPTSSFAPVQGPGGEHLTALCSWPLETTPFPVFSIDELVHRERAVQLSIGRVFRVSLSLTILHQHDSDGEARVLFSWTLQPYHFMLRNRVNFMYIIQHDAFCNASHLRHSDSEVLVVQWKQGGRCSYSDGCMFVPNSTVNEGRNAAWWSTFARWPGTVFTYYIFVDGDARLVFRPERSSLPVVDNVSSQQLPFRMLEKHLLRYSPAVGFPYYTGWHGDGGNDVQFASNYDHIIVAIHHNVSRMFLPTETCFDDESWWYGQRIHGFLASIAFSNQTLQFNALVSENGSIGKRAGAVGIAPRALACSAQPEPESSGEAFDHAATEASRPCKLFKLMFWCLPLSEFTPTHYSR